MKKRKNKLNIKNLIIMIIFLASGILLVKDLFVFATTIASYTYFGLITFVLTITAFGYSLNYLDELYKKVSAKELANTNNEK